MSLKPVTLENLQVIADYIQENQIIIGTYDDMLDTVLRMVRAKYYFPIDKDIFRSCLEELTYMYCPGDDMNKDRLLSWLDITDDEDNDEEVIDGDEDIEEIPTPSQ